MLATPVYSIANSIKTFEIAKSSLSARYKDFHGPDLREVLLPLILILRVLDEPGQVPGIGTIPDGSTTEAG